MLELEVSKFLLLSAPCIKLCSCSDAAFSMPSSKSQSGCSFSGALTVHSGMHSQVGVWRVICSQRWKCAPIYLSIFMLNHMFAESYFMYMLALAAELWLSHANQTKALQRLHWIPLAFHCTRAPAQGNPMHLLHRTARLYSLLTQVQSRVYLHEHCT